MSNGTTRRGFGGFLASGVAAMGLGAGVTGAQALETADITWTSDDPHLSGNYAPIGRETDADNLQVIAGRIPPDLSGAYLRNGPNPLYKPIFYAYPMDGDGMIHAVYLDNGRARYRNRFVQTAGLATERHELAAEFFGRAVSGLPPVGLERHDLVADERTRPLLEILQLGGQREIHRCCLHVMAGLEPATYVMVTPATAN